MSFFFLMLRRPPGSTRTDTLFPYTTLCRSEETDVVVLAGLLAGGEGLPSEEVVARRQHHDAVGVGLRLCLGGVDGRHEAAGATLDAAGQHRRLAVVVVQHGAGGGDRGRGRYTAEGARSEEQQYALKYIM